MGIRIDRGGPEPARGFNSHPKNIVGIAIESRTERTIGRTEAAEPIAQIIAAERGQTRATRPQSDAFVDLAQRLRAERPLAPAEARTCRQTVDTSLA